MCIFAPLFFLSCEDVSRDYMPLEPGRYWVFRTPEGRCRLEILKESRPGVFLAREPDGIHTWERMEGFLVHWTGGEAALLYPIPPHTGYRWKTESGDEHVFFAELLPREEVKTPAGTYAGSLHVKMSRDDDLVVLEMWFAPEVGMVRRKATTPAGVEEWLLESCGKKPPPAQR